MARLNSASVMSASAVFLCASFAPTELLPLHMLTNMYNSIKESLFKFFMIF